MCKERLTPFDTFPLYELGKWGGGGKMVWVARLVGKFSEYSGGGIGGAGRPDRG